MTPPRVDAILIRNPEEVRPYLLHLQTTDRISVDCEFRPSGQFLTDDQRAILASGTDEQRLKLIGQDEFKRISFDPYRNELITWQLGFKDGDRLIGLVFDVQALGIEFLGTFLRPILSRTDVTLLTVNGGVEYKEYLVHFKQRIDSPMRDLMWHERVLTAGQMLPVWATDPKTKESIQVQVPAKTGLAGLRVKYLGYDKDAAEEEKDTTRLSFIWSEFLTSEQIDYAARDVGDLLPIDDAQRKEFEKEENQRLIQIAQWEDEVIPVLGDMEVRGFTVNREKWTALADEAESKSRYYYDELQKVFIPDTYKKAVGDAFASLDLRLVKMVNPDSWKDVLRAWKGIGLLNICPDSRDCSREGHGYDCALLEDTHHATLLNYRRAYKLHYGVDECAPIDIQIMYREWEQRVKTFGHDWLVNINPVTGRVHSSKNQYGAKSGRFSDNNPNLQQIPGRGYGAKYRDCFEARPGHKLVTVDWSTIELRILAVVSGDPVMLEALRNDIDLHSLTASKILGADYHIVHKKAKDKTDPEHIKYKTLRDIAKILNFGIAYGMGAKALQVKTIEADPKGIGIPAYCNYRRKDIEAGKRCGNCARCALMVWRDTYKVAAKWLEDQSQSVYATLIAEDMAGGRRYFHRPDPNTIRRKILIEAEKKGESLSHFELQKRIREKVGAEEAGLRNEGRNHPIQGLNARMLKIAMRRIWLRLRPLKSYLVHVVHDESVGEAPCTCGQTECLDTCTVMKAKNIIVEEMEAAAQRFLGSAGIPTPAEASVGLTWSK